MDFYGEIRNPETQKQPSIFKANGLSSSFHKKLVLNSNGFMTIPRLYSFRGTLGTQSGNPQPSYTKDPKEQVSNFQVLSRSNGIKKEKFKRAMYGVETLKIGKSRSTRWKNVSESVEGE